ncbi:hypothetical protein EVAR_32510_1 [Eumeta japonica]|uniref:Uncharacterized protein n=1 Tax=Eumeta variegata TaxID=151549 RepID=A0A4C1W7E0_EUMVA|nr:hypothetical protein EVAR_32510_1 [Eumeta japonica]
MIKKFHFTLLEHLRILRLEQCNEPLTNLIAYAVLGYNSSIGSIGSVRRVGTSFKKRDLEKEYTCDQQVFVPNLMASGQILALQNIKDTVLADLPIHMYTKKKRGTVRRSRLKIIPNNAQLLQNPSDSTHKSSLGTASGGDSC